MADRDLRSSIKAYSIAIEKYTDTLYRPTLPEASQIVENGLAAIADISSLCHAHTTKIGIAFKPPVSVEAARKTLEDWMKLPVAYLAAYSSYLASQNGDKSDILVTQIRQRIREVLDCYKALLPELERSLDVDDGVTETSGFALRSIGQIWAKCDQIKEICGGNISDMVADELETYISFAEDASEELNNIDENEDKDEGEEKKSEKSEKSEKNRKNETETETEESTDFTKLKNIINLTILLWKAIVKRRCRDKSLRLGKTSLQNILTKSKSISADIDDLICEIAEGASEEDMQDITNQLSGSVLQLAELTKNGQGGQDKFSEWIDKFVENYNKKIN